MKQALVILLLLSSPPFGFGQSNQPARSPATAISGVTVIDGTGAEPRSGMTVVIIGDRISAIDKSTTIRLPPGARVINASGKFLIPGLWDMHVHLQEAGVISLPLFIANGVTSVRDMGTTWEVIRNCREAVATGRTAGPRIKASGPMITNPRIWDLIQKSASPDIQAREARRRIRVDTPEDMRKAVDDLSRNGADFIKLHWNNTRETYFALAEESRKRGLRFVGHDPLGGLTLAEISDAGQHSIEHIDGSFAGQLRRMDEAGRKATYERFIRNGTHFVPTLVIGDAFERLAQVSDTEARLKVGIEDPRGKYLPRELVDNWRWFFSVIPALPRSAIFKPAVDTLIQMKKAGVRIMPGTDLGVPLIYAGFSLHEELAQLTGLLGLTPMEALISATRYPAEFFGMQDSLGTIEKGKLADLVLLDANPLVDIRNTQKIDSVVAGGRVYSRKDLDALLEQVRLSASTR